MVDSQREIGAQSSMAGIAHDQNSAKQLINEFLSNQQIGNLNAVVGQPANKVTLPKNRLPSANKNSSQLGHARGNTMDFVQSQQQ